VDKWIIEKDIHGHIFIIPSNQQDIF